MGNSCQRVEPEDTYIMKLFGNKLQLIKKEEPFCTYIYHKHIISKRKVIKTINTEKLLSNNIKWYYYCLNTVKNISISHFTPIKTIILNSNLIIQEMPYYIHKLSPVFDLSPVIYESLIIFIISVCESLLELHSFNIYHGNLKPTNIFYEGKKIVLSDYCLNDLRSVKDFTTDCSYYSPEELYNGIVTEKSDIFSFGCILYYILSGGNRLFHNTSARSIIELEDLKVSKELLELLKEMLEYDYNKRINLKEIMNKSSKMNNMNYIFDWPLYHDVIFKVHNDLELIEQDESDEKNDKEYDKEMRSMIWKIIEIYNNTCDVKCLSYIINIIWQNYSYSLWQILLSSFKCNKIVYKSDGCKYLIDSLILNSIKDGYSLQLSNDSVLFSSTYLLHNLPLLQRFDYSHNSMTDSGLKHFCEICTSFRELISLDLSFNLITSNSMEVFSDTLSSLTDLKCLKINNNLIGDKGCMILSDYYNMLIVKEFKVLNLSGMGLTDNFAAFLSNHLNYLSILQTLDLSNNQITEFGNNMLMKEKNKSNSIKKINIII